MATLNEIIERKLTPYRNVNLTIYDLRDQINKKTLDLYITYLVKHNGYHNKYTNRIFVEFYEKKLLTFEIAHQLLDLKKYGVTQAITNLPFKFNTITLLKITHNAALCKVVHNMMKHNTPFDDDGFKHICKYMRHNLRVCIDKQSGHMVATDYAGGPTFRFLDEIFLHYTPPKDAIFWMMDYDAKCVLLMVRTFNIDIDVEDIEKLCLTNNISHFRKLIPKEMKLTLTCLHNACTRLDLKTIKTLVENYGIKPDNLCLEIILLKSTEVEQRRLPSSTHKVISYMLDRVEVSNKVFKMIISKVKLNKSQQSIYDRWNTCYIGGASDVELTTMMDKVKLNKLQQSIYDKWKKCDVQELNITGID